MSEVEAGQYEGLVVVVKEDCPTCTALEGVYAQLEGAGILACYTQDNPAFPASVSGPVHDTEFEHSYRLGIETVPTLLRFVDGKEVGRAIGWHREEWQALSGVNKLDEQLPASQPGCGALNVQPGMPEMLAVRFGDIDLRARRIEVSAMDDPHEACFERGWSDGLPVIPPTAVRVARMLSGTARDPQELLGEMPPDLAPCTVEKVAINAVMAGCKPEYLPVVLAVVEAALQPAFCMHGLLCTTYFSSPLVIVNGPVAKRIGMNSGVNALGQGNRANASIGRALQLVVRNVGGGIPGGIDRATLGTPGKYSFCFAEDESDEGWQPLHVARGFAATDSVVTLFAGDGVLGNFDQLSRTPESITRSLAGSLMVIGHPKKFQAHDALLVLSPEHYRIYASAGWDRARIMAEFEAVMTRPTAELVRGVGGIEEGMPESLAATTLTKFRPGGFNIARAGGQAGLMSAVIGGWAATGERGSELVSQLVGSSG
jgi:hypothetical protein